MYNRERTLSGKNKELVFKLRKNSFGNIDISSMNKVGFLKDILLILNL